MRNPEKDRVEFVKEVTGQDVHRGSFQIPVEMVKVKVAGAFLRDSRGVIMVSNLLPER